MFIILKERGDTDEKMGIFKLHDNLNDVEIIKHPTIPEGEVHHISHLRSLVMSAKSQYKRKE